MEEIFDVYTRDGKYLGTKEKSFCHSKNPGVYHKPTWIWIINSKNEVLVQRRASCKKTCPNLWENCGGHVEKGESYTTALVREAKEEIGITIKKEDLIFLAVNHHYQADHVQLYFSTNSYEGEPTVCEPQECGGLLWANLDNLPENTIPYVANVIEDIKLGIQFDDGDFVNLKSKKELY